MTAQTSPSRASMVRDIWADNEGNIPAAIDALMAVLDTPEFQATLQPVILRAWCRDQVEAHVGALRLAAVRSVGQSSWEGARLRQVINANLFDFPLPGGKRLADANSLEIMDGANHYRGSAEDAAHKARWLDRVAKRVGGRNRAEEALPLRELETLFEEARHV